MRGVQPELLGEDAVRRHVPGEDDQAARLAIDAVHGPHRLDPPPLRLTAARDAAELPEEMAADRIGHQLLEGGLHLPTPRRPRGLLVVPRRVHACRLLDHHHVVIDVHDGHVVRLGERRGRHLEHLDDLARLQPPGRVGADVAMHEHMP